MIEEPPVLTLHERRRRPDAASVAAFAGQPTGFVVDAMGGSGALGGDILPLDPDRLPVAFCGAALTVDGGPADVLALLAALAVVEPGDVLVVAARGHRACAAAGDRVMGMARNGGAVALVTDGPVRDHAGICAVGLPVFCTGLTPNSPAGNGPGSIGGPVVLGGVQVETGDIVLGDRDGVVVVPFARIGATIAALARVRELEAALDAEVAKGLRAPPALAALLASERCRRV